ncbi:MAG: diguanylate cyclase [Vicinamibacteria bacterium]
MAGTARYCWSVLRANHPNLEHCCVLIVDDEKDNVNLLVAVLGQTHRVLVASTGKRALELAPSADLILLDVMMPEMDGLEVCRRLRADEATAMIPVIFVTGLDGAEDESSGFEAGGVDYIVKPINPDIVRARVRTHLELKSARDLLERQATVDVLTDIANRRRFDEVIKEEWRRLARSSSRLTVAIADIDHFKAFNDHRGHAGGDACLNAVAQTLRRLWRRPGELVARYGGDEFALLLPNVDWNGAQQFVTRTLRAMNSVEVPGVASAGAIHLSIGAVSLIPSFVHSIAGALQMADEALYKAKEHGRHRGVAADLETAESVEILASGDVVKVN